VTAPVFDKALGKLIRIARTASGKTMGDVAVALKCSVTHVSDIELGRAAVTAGELKAIVELLRPARTVL
jgi:transcriptional regulator with XRE-family HTH domain